MGPGGRLAAEKMIHLIEAREVADKAITPTSRRLPEL